MARMEGDIVVANEWVLSTTIVTCYTYEVVYTIDYIGGSLTPLSSGTIAANEALKIAHRYKLSFEGSVGYLSLLALQWTVRSPA
jgi:hypothetical protein